MVRTRPTFLQTLISKSDCGPVKLPGLSRNGPQKRTLTDELVVFNSTGSERSKFHYSEQKVTWSSLNVSPLLCGLYVYEAWFLGLSDRRKRRAETRSRFTQPCLKPWERGWYFTWFNLLHVGDPHVLLAVIVFCELSLLAQNWKWNTNQWVLITSWLISSSFWRKTAITTQ